MRHLAALITLAVVTAACSGDSGSESSRPELAPITVAEFTAEIEASDRPLVVNLWASWCIPCRSEAPLLQQAHATFGDEIRFLGIATEDVPADSLAFLDEFDLTFDNRADRPGAILGHLGATGLPVTVFIRAGGEIMRTHYGVIDDASLALGIDDLLADG